MESTRINKNSIIYLSQVLSDDKEVKVLKNVFSAWGNALETVTIEKVQEIRAKKGKK